MDDKRIKLITKEMFIAWGMICIGFIVVDNIWRVFGITPMYTCQPVYTGLGAVAKAIIFYSNFLAFFINIILGRNYISLFGGMNIILAGIIGNGMLILVQIATYWYLGNLVGRFIVWIKHLRKKSLSEIIIPSELDK